MARFLKSTPFALLFSGLGMAQAQTAPSVTPTLAPVTVYSSAPATALAPDFLSFGDTPLPSAPVSATVIDAQQIESLGARRLSDLVKTDASVSDAYNVVGYWDYATMRGFVLNNQYNYRREGLPISAETAIGLDNKASVEWLKGTSGIQAGVSAPGGLVNYTVKRPTQNDIRSARIEVNSNGNVMGAADLGGRFGVDKMFGYRINAATEKLDNYASNTQGNRQLLALAGDWRATADSLFQFEIEYSHRAQPSVPGLSLLGNALPLPNPKLNLNNQPWSQPVVLDGLTGTVKFDQALNSDWRWTGQLGKQKLVSQDRVAFPYGCSLEGNYDRYCSDGTFDVYDYRSDNERRQQTAAQLQLHGQVQAGGVKHALGFTVLSARVKDRFQMQANNLVGSGSVFAPAPVPENPALTEQNTHRSERSLALSAYDTAHWTPALTTWLGLRHTQLHRASERTDGSRATDYRASFTAPWLAASYAVNPSALVYASIGQGVESEVAPARSQYTNSGEALPALKSKQLELGVKGRMGGTDGWGGGRWSVAVFEITRPLFGDSGACDLAGTCTRQLDGNARHRGLELNVASPASTAQQRWQWDAGVSFINATREGGTINPALNGLRPMNVPSWIARLNTEYRVSALPGLAVQAHVSHEGRRAVLADGSLNLPAWTRLDLTAKYKTTLAQTEAVWTLGVDNALNKRYFSESPTQFGHVYLFSGAPRTVRVGLQVHY